MNGIDFSSVADPATTAPDGGKHQKLKKAAQDFEGMLLGSLWKSIGDEMKESLQEGDPAAGSLVDMGVQAVGSAMAKQGGIGIARMVLKKMEKTSNTEMEVHGPK